MPRRRAVTSSVVLGTVLAVAACSSGSSGGAGPSSAPAPSPSSVTSSAVTSPSPSPSAPSAPSADVSPLTGLPGAPDRPVVVVKIENSGPARPQAGLGAADLVVEELVEGGATRFAVFFQSRDPGLVGPVRSVRNVDAQIAAPTRGVLAFSGGAKAALRVVRKADVRLVQQGDVGGAFVRTRSRRAPHNLYLRVRRVWAAVDRPLPAAPWLPFAPASGTTAGSASGTASTSPSPAGGSAAGRAVVRFSGLERPSWTWDGAGRRWLRSESSGKASVDASGARVAVDTVLVLRVAVGDAGYRDPAGNPVPESRFTGSGDAVLLAGGRAVTGTWRKGASSEPLALTASDGAPLTVPPGRTWVELLPVGGSLRVS